MLVFLIRRLAQSVVVVLVMSIIVFVGIFAIGNPIDILLSPQADQQTYEQTVRALGLDRPLWQQYLIFLGNAVRGDLGQSFVFHEPALKLILARMPATMELAFSAILLAMLIGIPLGILAGRKPHAWYSRTIMSVSIVGFSLPTFWVGLMLISVFAVKLGWLPASGRGDTVSLLGVQVSFLTWNGLQHLMLPTINLALFNVSLIIRLTRASVRENLLQDYVKFAYAKGLSQGRVIFVHVMKNIMVPIVTVIGLELGNIIAFAVVTETIFSWPGMGKLVIDAIGVLDRPVIVAYLMMTVFIFIVINLIVDVLYSLLDPRVRLGDAE